MPILASKLHIPVPRPHLVNRARLIARLNERLYRTLTLVSAPAGFGKTTLISAWITTCRFPIAWISLDEGDNAFSRFLAHFLAALTTVANRPFAIAEREEGLLGGVQGAHTLPSEWLLTTLLNEMATIPGRFILVLDDYHVIHSAAVGHMLTFLLDHAPSSQMHLVIATREDPRLPLSRLRARDQLTELRAADLRFLLAEAAEFLNESMGLDLPPEAIAALETRTEGWIAGLQLAALSMQGTTDTMRFVQAFAGSHRFVLDYLVEEVLHRQPEQVRDFLLQTAILAELSDSLCDAVTGRADGRTMLETLERGNLFLIPLDDQRHWFRYHHLFADVLLSRLMADCSSQIPDLHKRASRWYEQHALPPEAIRHALIAEDFGRAAGLIERVWADMDVRLQSGKWLEWAKALPADLVRVRPVLCAGIAWALLDSGQIEGCETYLRDAERGLEMPADARIVVDEAVFRSLAASIAAARSYRALALNDISAAVANSQRALELTPEDSVIPYIQALLLAGLAYYASGYLEAADDSFAKVLNRVRQNGDLQTSIGIIFVLAEIRRDRGRLREALNTCQEGLRLIDRHDASTLVGTGEIHRGLAEIYHEMGDLDTAQVHLMISRKLSEQGGLTGWQHRLCVAESHFQAAAGDLHGAVDLLDEAERVYVRSAIPDLRPIAARRVQLWIAQGRLSEAAAWAREQALSPEDEVRYTSEFSHLTLTRLLIARYRSEQGGQALQDVFHLLDRLLQAAEAQERMRSVIEIRVLQALAQEAQGKGEAAFISLEHALNLAQSEGYVGIFLAEGVPMRALLDEATQRGIAPHMMARLRESAGASEVRTPAAQPLIEPLSERELEVLRLLRTDLSGPEIARQLTVSLSTVRTHTQSIYSKLGVSSRRAAVRRAEDLDLA